MEPDEEGFMQISPNLDPCDSAERLLQFAKGMMAHSRTVPVPRTAQNVTVGQARYLPITPLILSTPNFDLPTLFLGTNWHPHRPLCDRTDRLQDAKIQYIWGFYEHRLSHGELLRTRTHSGQCHDGIGGRRADGSWARVHLSPVFLPRFPRCLTVLGRW